MHFCFRDNGGAPCGLKTIVLVLKGTKGSVFYVFNMRLQFHVQLSLA